MNLQPLYELQERLSHAAIAGTGLLQEDFRLRRALDALTPLANASPVFAKIRAGVQALLAAPQEQRGQRLMDVMSLVDAVVYTQGVSQVAGTLEPLAPGNGGYTQISYGQLQPLLQALTGTGSGRMKVIEDAWKGHPDYFRDFRVLPHVVKALNATYPELAELIETILRSQGKTVIPMLKADFDAAGKTEMARRVRLVAQLAGAEENDWYVQILPDAQKDVREAVIQALSLSQENAGRLLDLCHSERGKLKEAAMRAAAMMEDDACAAFWKQETAKKPVLVSCLKGVKGILAADLTAAALQNWLEKRLESKAALDQTAQNQLTALLSAANGKDSDAMRDFWRWAAGNMADFARIAPEQTVRFCDLNVAEQLQKTMMQTVLSRPSEAFLTMARELGEHCRSWFLCGAFLADLGTLSPAALFDRYGSLIVKTSLFRPETEAEASDRIQIFRALSAIQWNSVSRRYGAVYPRWDNLLGGEVPSGWDLPGLDVRWISLIADSSVWEDGGIFYMQTLELYDRIPAAKSWLMRALLNEDDPQCCAIAGKWLYNWTLETGRIQESIDALIGCGWNEWDGLLVKCFQRRGEISHSLTMAVIRMLPVSNLEKARLLRQVDELAQRKVLKTQYYQWPHEHIQHQITLLEQGETVEL